MLKFGDFFIGKNALARIYARTVAALENLFTYLVSDLCTHRPARRAADMYFANLQAYILGN